MDLSRPAGLRAGFHAELGDPHSGLVHAGEQWVPEHFMIEPHRHQVWEFYLQLHGLTRWAAGAETFTLSPGHLLGVPPGLEHHLAGRSGSHHFYFAAVDLAAVARRHPELDLALPRVVRHHETAGDLADAFAQLVRELTARRQHPRTGLALAVDCLVLGVVRAATSGQSTQLALHPAVLRVKHLLDRRFHEQWPLHTLAAGVGLAPTYLAELFQSQIGQPPHRYLMERRIDRGRQLLESSDLGITAIALSLGFSSSQHFARAFRKLAGTTPTAFRKRYVATDQVQVRRAR